MSQKRKLKGYYDSENIDWESVYRGKRPGLDWVHRMRSYWLRTYFGLVHRPNDIILDMGCADGSLARRVLSNENVLVGIDISSGYIKKAKARIPKACFLVADAEAPPFKDSVFNLLLCSEVLEHLPHPHDAIREIVRVTSSDILLTVPTPGSSWLARLYRLVSGWRYKPDANLDRHAHLRFFSSAELLNNLKRYGLNVRKIRGIGIFMLHYGILAPLPVSLVKMLYDFNKYVDIFLNKFHSLRFRGTTTVTWLSKCFQK